jgi:hypothetical protein
MKRENAAGLQAGQQTAWPGAGCVEVIGPNHDRDERAMPRQVRRGFR